MPAEKSNAELDLSKVSLDNSNSTFEQHGDQKKGEAIHVVEHLGKPTAAQAKADAKK